MTEGIKTSLGGSPSIDSIREALHGETATIAWAELQRLFAAGKVVYVESSLDLIEVAAAMQGDDKALFAGWLAENLVAPVTDEQASFWFAAESLLLGCGG